MPDLALVSYTVGSWSSDPVPDRTPPVAVVLVLHLKEKEKELHIGLRLKSKSAVNELIDILEHHKVDVWGTK